MGLGSLPQCSGYGRLCIAVSVVLDAFRLFAIFQSGDDDKRDGISFHVNFS